TVTAGGYHTCGLGPGGTAHCWGENSIGQVGDGTTTGRTSPVPVSTTATFATMAAEDHTCAVTTNGAPYCWGLNQSGQLGDETFKDRWSPEPVSGGLTLAAVTTGFDHACGVLLGWERRGPAG
ncbi:MAG: RCC1 domain-containing protein, partial [Gemmatimonadales bacterium]